MSTPLFLTNTDLHAINNNLTYAGKLDLLKKRSPASFWSPPPHPLVRFLCTLCTRPKYVGTYKPSTNPA
jgi:hypothetical protein